MSDAEITAAIAARPKCDWCGKKHGPEFVHKNQCETPGCRKRVSGYQSLFCKTHDPAKRTSSDSDPDRARIIFERSARMPWE